MNAPGLRACLEDCDAVLCDLWGTLHDGVAPYPGVGDTLDRLVRAGVPVCLLSNAPRPEAFEAARLADMGIAPGRYSALVTAGGTWQAWWRTHVPRGTALRHCGPEGNLVLFEGLGSPITAPVEEAAALVVTDLDPALGSLEAHGPMLQAALERGLVMHCVNPDRGAVVPGGRVVRGGAVGRLYGAMGGKVLWFGKPHRLIVERALQALGAPAPARTLMVGDNLATDIGAAAAFGMPGLLVGPGIAADGSGAVAPDAALPPGCRRIASFAW